jgi:hypothetical protein
MHDLVWKSRCHRFAEWLMGIPPFQVSVICAIEKIHTSIPHSGTRSRLLRTTIRSQIIPPYPGTDAGVGAIKVESLPLSARHFLIAPVKKSKWVRHDGDPKRSTAQPCFLKQITQQPHLNQKSLIGTTPLLERAGVRESITHDKWRHSIRPGMATVLRTESPH